MLHQYWLKLTTVFASALLLSGCAQDAAMDERPASAVMSGADDAASDIFYTSQQQADADLARFDRENPQCQLWTNWQRACSRTGADGATYCHYTPVDVAPSQVFCAADGIDGYMMIHQLNTVREKASFNRFCAEFDFDYVSGERACVEWSLERPFNGLRLVEVEHPWCNRWDFQVDPEENPEHSRIRGLYCASRHVPDWCEWPFGWGAGVQDQALKEEPLHDEPEASGRNEIVLTVGAPIVYESSPVIAVFCARKR